MKVEYGKLIFEKLVESNLEKRKGALDVAQAITVPEETQPTSHSNAAGDFSQDLNILFSRMSELSRSAALIGAAE